MRAVPSAPPGASSSARAEPGDAACLDYYRRLATGVAVVTACGASGWSGTTVSTLTSVSLDPPIVLCCFRHGSHTLAALERAGCFAVHLLTDDQADLADRFGRASGDSTRFIELGYETTLVRGAPVIADVLAVGWCDVHAIVEVGDHWVAYGRLTAVRVRHSRPLIWHDRRYRLLDAAHTMA